MFAQTEGRIRDFIFPLLLAEVDGTSHRYRELLGTGFVIGSTGIAITAGHVAKAVLDTEGSMERGVVAAFVLDTGSWWSVQAMAAEVHPVEDLAVVQLDNTLQAWIPSFLTLAGTDERASCAYQQWAYPQDVLYDIVENGVAKERPDLVYFEGYVRRCLTGIPVPAITGTNLFELSTPAGACASGSPLVKTYRPGSDWPVIGIYLGERHSDSGAHVGYALREQDIRDWTPRLLGGRSLTEVANHR